MRKKQNHEEQLITSMMTHMEINQPSQDFIDMVMDRVSYEPIPAKTTFKPLIGRSAWIVIGLLLSILLFVLIASYSQDPSLPTTKVPSSVLNLPDFSSYSGTFMEWVRGSGTSLTWYSLCLVSLFVLTALNQILKRPRIHHNLVL